MYTALNRVAYLGYEIPYTKVEGISDMKDLVSLIAKLNTTSKSWTLADYLQIWAHTRPDYVTLRNYINTYDIETSQIAQIMHSGHCVGSSNISDVIKKGEFKVKNISDAKNTLNNITDVLSIVPRMDRISNKTLIAAYSSYKLDSSYSHSTFLAKLTAKKDLFALSTNSIDEVNKLLNFL